MQTVEFEQPFHVFSASDVRTALPMEESVKAMKAAYQELSAGGATVPLRTHIALQQHAADVLVMSCYSSRLKQVGLKIITLHE